MRKLPILAAAFSLSLLAAPAMATPQWGEGGHVPPGQAKKEGGWMPPGQAKKIAQTEGDAPPPGPGNSANVHWCKANWWNHDGNAEGLQDFTSFSDCVTHFAHGLRTADDDEEDANEDHQGKTKNRSDGSNNQHGELIVTDFTIARDGTFVLRGKGAEDRVIVSVGGVSELVVGFGMAEPRSDGTWEVNGEWACQESQSAHDARFRAFDLDERVSKVATFPCRAEG